MNNMILEDDLSLNLCIMPTIYCVVVILEDHSLVRRELLIEV